MKVEPTGIVMLGVCSVQTNKCIAKKKPEAITAVWTIPSRNQIDVCRPCLDEKIRTGDWEAEGVRVPGMKHRADIAVFDSRHNITFVAEIKVGTRESESWIISNTERLKAEIKSKYCKYILYVTPVYSYLINIRPQCNIIPETEWKYKTNKLLSKYITVPMPTCDHQREWAIDDNTSLKIHQELQNAVEHWLKDVASKKIKPEAFDEELLTQLGGGKVEAEVLLQ